MKRSTLIVLALGAGAAVLWWVGRRTVRGTALVPDEAGGLKASDPDVSTWGLVDTGIAVAREQFRDWSEG